MKTPILVATVCAAAIVGAVVGRSLPGNAMPVAADTPTAQLAIGQDPKPDKQMCNPADKGASLTTVAVGSDPNKKMCTPCDPAKKAEKQATLSAAAIGSDVKPGKEMCGPCDPAKKAEKKNITASNEVALVSN